ncbi:DUF2771 family protein [Gordonia sp. NPDC003422]
MNLSSGEKKAVSIIAAVAVAFVAVVGVSVFLLVRDAPEEHVPYLHLSVDGDLHRIEPVRWCDIFVRHCDPPLSAPQSPTPQVAVPIGSTAALSVSGDIAEGPWALTRLYSTPKGLIEDEGTFQSGTTFTVMLRSQADRVLIGLTVNLPSALVGPDGTIDTARGTFAIDTKPQDYVIPQV